MLRIRSAKLTPILICASLLCAFLSSCASSNTDSLYNYNSSDTNKSPSASDTVSDTDGDSSYSDDILSQNFPSYDEIQAQYGDKTVLVWTIEETGYERNYPFRTKEINEYLDAQGYDFAVCFYPIPASQIDEQNSFYSAQVEAMAENGENIDIIYSAGTDIAESGSGAYHRYIYNGLFEPLDGYFDTEAGKKLYNIMPESHWEGLRVNGHIYGVDGAMHTLSSDYGYFVNAELAEKYGFDTTLPIEDQLDILKAVQENEICDVFAMYFNLGVASLFVDIKALTPAVYLDEQDNTAKCVLDNAQYLSRLDLIGTLHKEGLLVDIGMGQKDSFFILQESIVGGSTIYSDSDTVSIDYNGNSIEAIPVFREQTSVRSSNITATGICSYSKNKDKAFELLALTQTDPYLNNLLTYGLEGTDYDLVDGTVDNIINYVSIGRFANYMVCHPSGAITTTPQQYTEIYENARIADNLGFAFDGRDFIEQSSATSDLILSLDFSSEEEFSETIDKLRQQLFDSGLQSLIDECNRQYEEYTEGRNES